MSRLVPPMNVELVEKIHQQLPNGENIDKIDRVFNGEYFVITYDEVDKLRRYTVHISENKIELEREW